MALLLFKVVSLVPTKVQPKVWVLLSDELGAWKTESLQSEKVSEPIPFSCPLLTDHRTTYYAGISRPAWSS
jgi:hypothetical protein